MKFSDEFFNKVEKKTNVDKETILGLAKKVQNSNMKDEQTLRSLIQDVSKVAGKSVSKEKEDKIIGAILNDKVPNNIDKFVN